MPTIQRFARALAVPFAAMASGVASAQLCTPFTDVPASDPFCEHIQWIYTRGITLGCTATQYCPAQFVRRDQMAAFLSRANTFAVLSGGNAFGGDVTIGTRDDYLVKIIVNGQHAMRFESTPFSPNLIGGHEQNSVAFGVRGATIGGGGAGAGDSDPDLVDEGANVVTDAFGTISGGYANQAGANDAGNPVSAPLATVSGGIRNTASGSASTVAGGGYNTASGIYSTVAGGNNNTASGTYSFAAGHRARSTTVGSFTWADANPVDFNVPVNNFFAVRATGGIGLTVAIDPSNGGGTQYCDLAPGIAGWQCVSDRNAKENFERAQGEAILEKLAAMPLYSWNFKGADPAIRNLGPTAQDFRAAFDLGVGDKSIAEGNLHGVALAAIQGLNARLESLIARLDRALAERDARIEAQGEEIVLLRSSLAAHAPTEATGVVGDAGGPVNRR